MREGSHGARDLAHAQVFGGRAQPFEVAPRFAVPDRKLKSEGDRLGMHAVGAADLHGVFELEGPPPQHRAQTLQPGQQNLARLPDLQRLRRIHDVVRSEPVMQPPRRFGLARRPHALGYRGGKRNHVVPDFLLDLQYPSRIEGGMGTQGTRRFGRHHAHFSQRFGSRQLHFKPLPEFVFVAPDAAHLRPRISRDQNR
jgi:hypothetical protein